MKNPFANKKGKVVWQSPSNIALIKYWGKFGNQLPKNSSISFTLKNAFTETEISYQPKETKDGKISIHFLFEDQPNTKFENKIQLFLESILIHFPFLEWFNFEIKSNNSFPHSTGIASSASSMSALALCLCSIEKDLYGGLKEHEFFEKASMIARLGSGSACRSIYPKLAVWGKHENVIFSSNEFAIEYKEIHPVFSTFKDAILIVSAKEKSVSSRAGHQLMENNPFATARYQQANQNLTELLLAMKDGNVAKFGEIVETEAMTLHALMMCSSPNFILIHPNTLKIIDLIKQFRQEKQLHLYFTLDAGPNVHLLYPSEIANEVSNFIQEKLLPLCENQKMIQDEVGNGPKQIM